jgi:glycosyltransferase involved in cell wall biosynthesis
MRILEICFSHSLGGLELYMADISLHLVKNGFDVWTIVPDNSELQKRLQQNGLNSYPMSPKFPYLDIFLAKKISRIIKDNKIDVIHAHKSTDLSSLIIAKKFAKRSKIIFTQQMESSRKKKDIFHNWVYKNLDGLIAITEIIKNQVALNTLLPLNRLFHLYYGINLEKFRPNLNQREIIRKKYKILSKEVVVGIVGRLEEGKGQQILIRAVNQLKNLIPQLKVLIIGSETINKIGFLDYLKNLVKTLKLSDRIIFTGFEENVHTITAALDIVVLASRKETFGLSLIECMAQNIAPIGTDAGGVPEIICNGENGFLVPPFDVPALSQAIKLLVENDSLRIRIATRARETVITKFELTSHLRKLEEIFKQVRIGAD